jgi:hypothetical protein
MKARENKKEETAGIRKKLTTRGGDMEQDGK